MLSNLANYILGYSEPAVADPAPTPSSQDVRLTAVETEEDDWLMVERTGASMGSSVVSEAGSEEGPGDEPVVLSRMSSPKRERSAAGRLQTQAIPEEAGGQENEGARRTGSAEELTYLSMEESWFLTPPPCFSSTGPVTLETSPLEDLLIEHPSMSVYHQGGQGPQGRGAVPARALSPRAAAPAQPPAPAPRAPLHPIQHPRQIHHLQPHGALPPHKQVYVTSQSLKKSQIDRGNKAREVNSSRNRRQRRSDRQKNHSGANNNRKC